MSSRADAVKRASLSPISAIVSDSTATPERIHAAPQTRSERVRVPVAEKVLLSPEEVSALTGISRARLYRLLARGEIQSFKDVGRRFIPRWAVDTYIEAKARQATVA